MNIKENKTGIHYDLAMDSPTFIPRQNPAFSSPISTRSGWRRTAVLGAIAVASALLGGTVLAADEADTSDSSNARAADSGMSAELLYRLLIGELQLNQDQAGAAFSITLDAAKKYGRPEIFRRAIEIALQARSGESALVAAKAWVEAQPRTAEAQRYLLQILLSLQRPAEIGAPLRVLLQLTPLEQRQELLATLQGFLLRIGDKSAALKAASPVLLEATKQPALAIMAWTVLGQFQVAAGEGNEALESARKGLALNRKSSLPAWLAVLLTEQGQAGAEALLLGWLDKQASTDTEAFKIRLEYARWLTEKQQQAAATQQTTLLLQNHPKAAEPWLLSGLLALQKGDSEQAYTALERYLSLLTADAPTVRKTQAKLLLSQIAETRANWSQALAWLDDLDENEGPSGLVLRRAILMARQGQLDAARTLLQQQLPSNNAAEERIKWLSEAELLREVGETSAALEIYQHASARFPDDSDLLYQYAMQAEKANQYVLMEELLQKVITQQPEHAHAHNALGYSWAERNTRLDEARQLIEKALSLLPNDPFIQDSMGWVEFRQGNLQAARRWLETAYRQQADVEIAAHLGEVLWQSGEREAALTIWRQARQKQRNNSTLQDTLQRLQVQP